MPLTNLNILTGVLLIAAGLLFFRERIVGALQRFDERNRARRAEEFQARFDRYAHYRQTIALAEEQIEQVTKIREKDERTGETVERYLFGGDKFVTMKEAEEARFAAVIGVARDFYRDLDKIYFGRWARREAMKNTPNPDETTPPHP